MTRTGYNIVAQNTVYDIDPYFSPYVSAKKGLGQNILLYRSRLRLSRSYRCVSGLVSVSV